MASLLAARRAKYTKPTAQYRGPLALYDLLYDYYLSNGLYSDIAALLKEEMKWGESMRSLRNPANRVVEFYVSKLWAGTVDGALPMQAKQKAIIPVIEQIWKWSNWAALKQRFARWFSLFGDGFLKIARNEEATRVFFQVIDPRWVTDFKTDERGYLIYIRIDMMHEVESESAYASVMWRTEIWTPESRQVWRMHTKGRLDTKSLGVPDETEINELGFIPIVHAPFRDIGEVRGAGCFVHALDQIDEINRMTTRLHQILFRYGKPIWALETEATGAGKKDARPRPPKLSETGQIEIEEETLLATPPGSKLHLMVPEIRYDAALSIINAMMEEMAQNLPEMKYYQLNKSDQASGVALRYMLGDAIDRVIEARGNAYAALVRANEIALSLAQLSGLEGFSADAIGTYEQGSFEHSISDVPVIPLSETERATTLAALIGAGIDPLLAMQETGWTDEQIKVQEQYMAKKQEAALAIANATPKADVSDEEDVKENDPKAKPPTSPASQRESSSQPRSSEQ